jgi:hypothetical protein
METVFLFCRAAATDNDGLLNIEGVFNELYAPDFPARQESMVLAGVIEWGRDTEGRIPFTIDLTDPDGKPIFSIDGHSDVEKRPLTRAPAKTQLVLPLENVMFTAPGQYRVRLKVNGQEIAGPSMHLMQSE